MSGCVRALLVLTNIVFLMSGSGVVALGVWMIMDPNIETYFNVLNVDQDSDSFTTICYVLFAVGGFVVFVAFTGCCGGIKSNKCMLTMFLVTIAVITVMEAGLSCMVILNLDSPTAIPVLSAIYSDVEENLKTMLKQSIVHKYLPDTLIGTTWDSLQIQLECCGATGPIDYAQSAWKNDTLNDLTIPETCCTLISKDSPEPEPSNKLLCQAETLGFYHDIGCYDVMVNWFQSNSMYIIAAGGSVLAIEIFSFIFALIICRRSCKEEEKMKAKQKT